MLFAFHGLDKPNSSEIRAANRAAHLDYLAAHADRILVAGPMLSDDGTAMAGSLLIIDFEDRAAAEAFAAADPYAKAGLFQSMTIRPWKQVYPKA